LTVLGRPPHQAFVPWTDASIGGCRATDVLDAPGLARLDARLAPLWPPGPLSLAAAAVRVVALAQTRAPGWPSLFVVPAGAPTGQRKGVTLPVSVTPDGLVGRWPTLSSRDRVRLETALSAAASDGVARA
jgi:hypothetical protein